MRLLNFMNWQCRRKQSNEGNWMTRRISNKLKLDESQQAKLMSLSNALVSSRAYLANSYKEHENFVDKVFSSKGVDRDLVALYLDVPRIAITEQAPVIVDALDEFYQSLNDVQQEKLRLLMKNRLRHRHYCIHKVTRRAFKVRKKMARPLLHHKRKG